VITDDLDVVRVAILPAKTDAPLIVDSDRVLSGSNSVQRFEPETRRLEIVKRTDLVENGSRRCAVRSNAWNRATRVA
jgi:hypothetical protein